MRTCRCACGGTITAFADTDTGAMVALHNRTRIHRAWRRTRDKVEATDLRRRRLRAEIAEIRLRLELERVGHRP